MIEVIQIPALKDNYIYLIIDKKTKTTACVDPSVSESVLNELKKRDLNLNFIFNTHHHQDHVGGNLEIKSQTNCKIVGPKKDSHRIPGIDIKLKENDEISVGQSFFKIYEVPGHTLGHICYFSSSAKLLFSGDTLFSIGCGRVFEGSNKQMWESLLKIRALPDNTNVYCGHEYTKSNILFSLSLTPKNKDLIKKKSEVLDLLEDGKSTMPFNLGLEKKLNPFLKADDKDYLKDIIDNYVCPQSAFNFLREKKDIF